MGVVGGYAKKYPTRKAHIRRELVLLSVYRRCVNSGPMFFFFLSLSPLLTIPHPHNQKKRKSPEAAAAHPVAIPCSHLSPGDAALQPNAPTQPYQRSPPIFKTGATDQNLIVGNKIITPTKSFHFDLSKPTGARFRGRPSSSVIDNQSNISTRLARVRVRPLTRWLVLKRLCRKNYRKAI